jgi:hypothetical protein
MTESIGETSGQTAEAVTHVTLWFELRSAATFGRGEGVAGLVDQEVEHDEFGLPYLRGRTLRGLLTEEIEGVLYALERSGRHELWGEAKSRLIGESGKMLDDETGILSVDDARLPENLRQLLACAINRGSSRITPSALLDTLTTIRRQTAMTPEGAPDPASLRAMRVLLRGLISGNELVPLRFESPLVFDRPPKPRDLALLAAATLAWRRAGTGRNRGRGRLRAWLNDDAQTLAWFTVFKQEVTGK